MKRSMNNRYKNKNNKENYSVFLKHVVEDDKEETSRFAKTLLILVLLVCTAVVGFLFLLKDEKTIEGLFGKDTEISKALIGFAQSQNNKRRGEFSLPFLPRRQNILLLGVDSNGSKTDPWRGTRSDTIVLLNIDPTTRSVNAISVPRDSKVYLPGDNGVQKINAAHALGGVKLVKQAVEETLGVKVDRYVIVSDQAVEKLVDAIGGVPIYVEKRMNYDDYSGGLHVHLSKGDHLLEGRESVGYLRFRHDGLGDIGRTQRQQWFLRGLLSKLQTPQAIVKIPEVINIASTYVKTDLSLYEMSQYAALAKSFDLSKIEVATLPGGPNKRGRTSYWILDPEKTQEVVNRLVYRDKPEVTDRHFSAGIMYSSDKEQEAMALKASLQELGYDVNCVSRGHLPHSQFIANTNAVTTEFFSWLKKKVPAIKDSQFVYDPNKFYCVNSDFVVILSGQ